MYIMGTSTPGVLLKMDRFWIDMKNNVLVMLAIHLALGLLALACVSLGQRFDTSGLYFVAGLIAMVSLQAFFDAFKELKSYIDK